MRPGEEGEVDGLGRGGGGACRTQRCERCAQCPARAGLQRQGGDVRGEATEDDTIENEAPARPSRKPSPKTEVDEDVDVESYLKSLGDE